MASSAPFVELLWWDGCPSWPAALRDLRAVLDELGMDPEEVSVRELRTGDEAEAEGFIGSPTIRVDGTDLLPTGDEPTALTCRVYRRRDGRYSPSPDPDDLRDALRRRRNP